MLLTSPTALQHWNQIGSSLERKGNSTMVHLLKMSFMPCSIRFRHQRPLQPLQPTTSMWPIAWTSCWSTSSGVNFFGVHRQPAGGWNIPPWRSAFFRWNLTCWRGERRFCSAGGGLTKCWMTGWWFGTSILFSHLLGIIIPIDFHIFQRGSNHQPDDVLFFPFVVGNGFGTPVMFGFWRIKSEQQNAENW